MSKIIFDSLSVFLFMSTLSGLTAIIWYWALGLEKGSCQTSSQVCPERDFSFIFLWQWFWSTTCACQSGKVQRRPWTQSVNAFFQNLSIRLAARSSKNATSFLFRCCRRRFGEFLCSTSAPSQEWLSELQCLLTSTHNVQQKSLWLFLAHSFCRAKRGEKRDRVGKNFQRQRKTDRLVYSNRETTTFMTLFHIKKGRNQSDMVCECSS